MHFSQIPKGAGSGRMIMAPDPDRQFTLKQAEIAVFNRNVWDLLWDFTVIADMAKVCDYLFTFISIYERLIVLTQQ